MSFRLVLVIENDNLLRNLMAIALEVRGYTVETAENVIDAKRILHNCDPDGLLLDVDFESGPNGFEFVQSVLKDSPGTGVVLLTPLPDAGFANLYEKVLPAGIAYLRKPELSDLNELYEALDVAMRGEVSPEQHHDLNNTHPFSALTVKQIEVLRLMSDGKSNAQIAEARGTSLKATEDSIRRACRTIRVDGSTEGESRTAAVVEYLSRAGIRSITNYVVDSEMG